MLTTMKDIMKLKLEKGFGFTLSMLDRIREAVIYVLAEFVR